MLEFRAMSDNVCQFREYMKSGLSTCPEMFRIVIRSAVVSVWAWDRTADIAGRLRGT